jgi:hypothetical protein
MSKDIKDMLYRRGQVVDQMRSILDKAEAEDRDLNVDEQAEYEKLESEQADLKVRADRHHRQATLDASLEKVIREPVKIGLKDKQDTDEAEGP